MFSYLQMPFLQALGYAIANSIWQVFLLWLIVLLVNSLAKQSSHIRYVTALSAQVAGFVWFLTTFQFYYQHCHAASIQAKQLGSANVYMQNVVFDSNNLLSVLIRAEETLPYLSLAYLILLLYLVARWIQNFRFTKTLSTIGLTTIDGKWQSFVKEMSDKLSIMQDVKIYLSSVAKSPLTIGYLKPIILLPIASLNHLTAEQMEAVILHELAHIRRSDYIINMLVSVAEMIMFFNPFTRLLSRAIQKERENCCDDWVLQYQYNAGMYAEALLRIATLQQQGFQMNAAAGGKGELLQRIKRMVQPSEKKFSYRHQVAAMMFIAALLFCIAWLQPNENTYHRNSTSINRGENKNVVIAPMVAQVDNPFFNGASLLSSSLHDDVMKQVTDLDKAIADSAAKTGIREARKALKTAAPLVVSTLTSGNWQRVANEAIAKAGQSLKNVNMNFSVNGTPLVDSAFLVQTVNEALANVDYETAINTGFEAAGKELEKLEKSKALNNSFSFSFDNLNQLGVNALATLRNIHLDVLKDSLAASSEKLRKATEHLQKERAAERRAAQTLLLKQVQERQNRIQAQTDRFNTRRNRSEMPAPPAALVAEEDNDDAAVPDACSLTDDAQPASYSWTYSTPTENYTKALQYKTAKTIHITRSDDSGNINIVIEIRQ